MVLDSQRCLPPEPRIRSDTGECAHRRPENRRQFSPLPHAAALVMAASCGATPVNPVHRPAPQPTSPPSSAEWATLSTYSYDYSARLERLAEFATWRRRKRSSRCSCRKAGRLHDQHLVDERQHDTRTYVPNYVVNGTAAAAVSGAQQCSERGAVHSLFTACRIAAQSESQASASPTDAFLDAFRIDRHSFRCPNESGRKRSTGLRLCGPVCHVHYDLRVRPVPERSRPQRFHSASGPHVLSARFVSVHAPGAVAHRALLREQQRELHRGNAAVAPGDSCRRHHRRRDREPADVRAGRWMVVHRLEVDRVHGQRPGHRGSGHRAERCRPGVRRRFSERPGSGTRLRDRQCRPSGDESDSDISRRARVSFSCSSPASSSPRDDRTSDSLLRIDLPGEQPRPQTRISTPASLSA